MPFAYLSDGFVKHGLLALAIGLLFVEAVPNLYPSLCQEEPFPTINTVHSYERETGLVGVDPEGSYFPRTVRRRPSESALEKNYQQSEFPQRFLLPNSVTTKIVDASPLGGSVEVTADEPFTAVYQSFDFAGWEATIDGQRIPINPTEPEGLITFDVPAGSHTLAVSWHSTPLRSTLLGLSVLAMAGTAVVGFVLFERREEKEKRKEKREERREIGWGVLVVAVGLIGLKFGVLDRVETPLRRVDALSVPQTVLIQGGELEMSHFSIPDRNNPSDAVLEIKMAWTAVSYPSQNYQTNVWLEDEQGQLWSDKNTFRPRKYEDAPPTLFWQPSQWGWESWEIEPLAGIPPGNYNIVMTLFDWIRYNQSP